MYWVQLTGFVGGCAAAVMAAPPKPEYTPSKGIPMPAEFRVLQDRYHQQIYQSLGEEGCTKDSIAKRRSWDDLDDDTRKDYIRAVHCLANKPALTDKSLAPGVVNRLDDFTYIHINQTNIIHQSGYLLPWHRLFLWQLEEALRNECGYKDYLPYWDNARFSADQTQSRVWDGSATTSFGGNGAPRAASSENKGHNSSSSSSNSNDTTVLLLLPGLAVDFWLPMPRGTGGGCVTTGPFTNLTLTLGPVAKPAPDPANKYGYLPTPRCLARSFEYGWAGAASLTWGNATALVGGSGDIGQFRAGVERVWHRQSHTFVGGDGADPYSPTNDPVFYLLHAQIDRLWALWQGQGQGQGQDDDGGGNNNNRTYAIAGNRTFFGIPLDYAPDVPPSLATIEDPMDMGLGFRPLTKEGMPTTELGRCYIYV